MKLLLPIAVTEAMLGAGTTIVEPAAGETAWVSGGTYALGDVRIRTTTHRKYECVQASAGRTAPPETDSAYWQDRGPTLRHAPFDQYISTPARATGSLTYVLSPGYFNALGLWGIDATQLSAVLKDAPGGAVIYSRDITLSEPPAGWYEFLFSPLNPVTKLVLSDLPIRPAAELTLTFSAAAGVEVGIGMIVCGDYRSLVGDGAPWGGTQSGSTAEPVTYSYIKTEDDGTTKIVRRHAATGMRATVLMPRSEADAALALVQSVLDVPVGWIASDLPGRAGLNVFGLGSATVRYDPISTMDINVKGMI